MSKVITQIEAMDYLSILAKETVVDYLAESETVDTIIDQLLAFQLRVPAITKGTIAGAYSGLTRSIQADGDSILRVLLNLRDTVGGYLEVDNDRQLNWSVSLGTDVGQQIRYRKNLVGITRDIDYSRLVNRLYAYGEGEGDARIKLSDADGQEEDYVEDGDSQTEWGGIYIGVEVDRSITHPDTLLAWANLRLDEVKNPPISYWVDTLDLSAQDGFAFDALQLGSLVTVIDEDLGLDVDVYVVKIEHPDLLNPQMMVIELANRVKDIADTLAEVYDLMQFERHIATVIGAGNVIVKGAFTVLDWATGGETTIRGDYITTGTIALGTLNFIPLTSAGATGEIIATINATAEGIVIDANKVSVNAGKRIYKQPGIPTSNSEGDLWFDTDDDNKLYRAACAGADEITPGEWELVQDAGIVANAASIVVNSDQIALNVIAIENNEDDIVINAAAIVVNADNILLKVSKNDVINQINISTEGIKIDADNITLDGVVAVTDDIKSSNYVAATSGWIIEGDGDAEFNDVTVRGNIQAQAGSSISAGYLTGGTITGKTIIIDGATGILKSSDYVAATSGWQIKGNGVAEFNEVTVRGAVYATSGEFTGTIKASDIEAGKTLTVNGAISAASGAVVIDVNGITIKNEYLRLFYNTNLRGYVRGYEDSLSLVCAAGIGFDLYGQDYSLIRTTSDDIEIDPDGGNIIPGSIGGTDIGTESEYFGTIECVTLDDSHSPAPAIPNPLEELRKMSTKFRRITLKEVDKEHLGKHFRKKVMDAGGVLDFEEKDKSTFPPEILHFPTQEAYDKAEHIYQRRLRQYAERRRSKKPVKGVPIISTSVFDEIWLIIRAIQQLADRVETIETIHS